MRSSNTALLIWNSRGRISIAELSQDMGQSDRWLRDKHDFLEDGQFHDFYYNQAHFIKEFKRFMGHPSAKYATLQNEVGEIIYHIQAGFTAPEQRE